jgi:hypothetical protein
MAKPDQKQLQEVMDNYQRVLSGYFQKEVAEAARDMHEKREEHKVSPLAVGTIVIDKDLMVSQQKLKLMQQMGPDLYQRVYTFMAGQRASSPATNEQAMYDELKRIVGGDKKLLSLCFSLDGIIFQEILQREGQVAPS